MIIYLYSYECYYLIADMKGYGDYLDLSLILILP